MKIDNNVVIGLGLLTAVIAYKCFSSSKEKALAQCDNEKIEGLTKKGKEKIAKFEEELLKKIEDEGFVENASAKTAEEVKAALQKKYGSDKGGE